MGFKKTSDMIAISFNAAMTAVDTYREQEVSLQLDVLNNEIFVVLAIDLNPSTPQAIAGVNTLTAAAVSTTSQATLGLLNNSNVLAVSALNIRDGTVPFTRLAGETYTGDLDYIGLIATNNFFVGIDSANTASTHTVNGRMFGYRAKADASTYAALVQSEVLSS